MIALFSFNFQVKVESLDLLIGEDKEAETRTVVGVILKSAGGEDQQ